MTSPFLNVAEAAIYLRFVDEDGRPKLEAFRHFVRKRGVRTFKCGSLVRYHVDDIHNLAVLQPPHRQTS